MSQTVVVIGAVALGPKAACRFKRLEPESRVVMIDQSDLISYGGCGIPYFISGDISDPDQLQSTSFHMVRDASFFKNTKDIDVMTRTRALSIDRGEKTVLVEDMSSGKQQRLPYDQLVLATGSRPRTLPVPGAELDGVYTVTDLNKAIAVKRDVAEGKVNRAVLIGGGAIGLEIAESLADLWGIETHVVELQDQVLPGIISPNMARMVKNHLEEKEVTVHLGEKVQRMEGTDRVQRLVTENLTLEADLVIMAAGVVPNVDLARDAGLDITPRGAITVNERMQTSDPAIYSGGDCVEIPNLITGKQGFWPLGSLANRQGRVIGSNLAGRSESFKGAVGSFVIKLFDVSVAGAGLSLDTALGQGFDAVSAFVAQFDHAHFYPEKDLMYLELVVEKGSGRVLGIQGLGDNGDALLARVGAVAPLLQYGPKTADISNLELPYAPPFSSAMDIVNALGNAAENLLEGKNRVINADEFADWWDKLGKDEVLFLDCREWGNAEPFVNAYPDRWRNIPQGELRKHLAEVPRDKRIVLICNTGVRSYEAQIILDEAGIGDSYNLQGGVAALRKLGLELVE
ncbi:MAG: FAD-dependent oxidoreductase [Deltaproteobacteria bacterium]|nr:FAD-dependent oxidoreductase [Deltaproteobacteria bacterium]